MASWRCASAQSIVRPSSSPRVDLGPAGEVLGGSLEQSNVDTAEEPIRLIEAQRGFQANARVVTAQNDLLSEVVNLI